MSIYDVLQIYNSVVGYYGDKVIVKRDDGELFFCEIPNNLIMLGETIAPKDLTSISELPVKEQEEIKKMFEDCEV